MGYLYTYTGQDNLGGCIPKCRLIVALHPAVKCAVDIH